MPIMNVIKNNAMGNMLCYKVPYEDFNVGSQLIVAEYEEALFMKDGLIENSFGPGKYSLTTENYPFITKFMSKLLTGGVSAFNCKVYYINKSHHLELKWGTGSALRVLDPVWGIEMHVQARGAYTVQVKDGKKFFLKLVGANGSMEENEIVRNFRTAFIQNITDELANYLTSQEAEVLVSINRKKQLADGLAPMLNEILDEYGLELVNFYIESIEVPENDDSMKRVREMRIQRKEREFEREQNVEDERMRFSLRRESSEADRYVSGQMAHADYERMAIRDQDGNNGWARQEAAEIMREAAKNEGIAGGMMGVGVGLGVGTQMGDIMGQLMGNNNSMLGGSANAGTKVICSNCNSPVPNGMAFCGNCGTKVEIKKPKCTNCGADLIPGMKFCGNCGTMVVQQKKKCSNCGMELPDGMKFCGGCGTKVEE